LGRTGLRAADKNVPPGALVSFLQKGLQYVQLEEQLDEADSKPATSLLTAVPTLNRVDPPIQLQIPPAAAAAAVRARLVANGGSDDALVAAQAAMPMLLETVATAGTKRPAEVKQQKNAKKQKTKKEQTETAEASQTFPTLQAAVQQLEAKKDMNSNMEESNDTNEESDKVPAHQGQEAPKLPELNGQPPILSAPVNGSNENHAAPEPAVANNRLGGRRDLPPVDDSGIVVPVESVLQLDKHKSEVFMCAWNPIHTRLIATGSGDASARIWEMGSLEAAGGMSNCIVLPHNSETQDSTNKDVTTLEWSSSGELLATGSYDGVARIWSKEGTLLHTLKGHNGPIFSLKWNPAGTFLLSGSYDKTTIVWDVAQSKIHQQLHEHTAPALDVDWKDNEVFASCSTDKTVHVCKVGADRPLKIYRGHADEVNGVKWDPSGKYLASCSDDKTAKVWEVDSDRMEPLYSFDQHTEEIYTLKWSPSTSKHPLLATASFDGTVMLWNVQDGSRFRIFDRHRDSVYSVAFSPSGDYLASGSLAGQMYIWDIEGGKAIESYKGRGDIFEVSWNKEESRVAGCFSSNVVAIVDFKKTVI